MFDHYGSYYSPRPFFLESSSSPFTPIHHRGREALYSSPTCVRKERLAKQRALRQAALEREEEDHRRELQMQHHIQKQREEEQRKRIIQKMEMKRARLAAQKEQQKRRERQSQLQRSESSGNSRPKYRTEIVQGSDGNLYRVRVPVNTRSKSPRIRDQSSSSKLSAKAVSEDKEVAEREVLAKKPSSQRTLAKEENTFSDKEVSTKKKKKVKKAAKQALRHGPAPGKVSETLPAHEQDNYTLSPQDISQQEMEWEDAATLQPSRSSSKEEEEIGIDFTDRKANDDIARTRNAQKKRQKIIVEVEDASDDDDEYSFANSLVPGAGESWMEPVGRT